MALFIVWPALFVHVMTGSTAAQTRYCCHTCVCINNIQRPVQPLLWTNVPTEPIILLQLRGWQTYCQHYQKAEVDVDINLAENLVSVFSTRCVMAQWTGIMHNSLVYIRGHFHHNHYNTHTHIHARTHARTHTHTHTPGYHSANTVSLS